MGTHSMTFVLDSDTKNVLAAIYSQYDGYYTNPGVGYKLRMLLKDRMVGNGIPCEKDDDLWKRFSNGMQDLAAQIVCYLKEDSRVGNIYLYPIPSMPKDISDDERHKRLCEYADQMGAWEYVYIIEPVKGKLRLTAYDDGALCRKGSLNNADPMLMNPATGMCAPESEWREDYKTMSCEEWGGDTFESAGLVPVVYGEDSYIPLEMN